MDVNVKSEFIAHSRTNLYWAESGGLF